MTFLGLLKEILEARGSSVIQPAVGNRVRANSALGGHFKDTPFGTVRSWQDRYHSL